VQENRKKEAEPPRTVDRVSVMRPGGRGEVQVTDEIGEGWQGLTVGG